jgi:hypothetical protein
MAGFIATTGAVMVLGGVSAFFSVASMSVIEDMGGAGVAAVVISVKSMESGKLSCGTGNVVLCLMLIPSNKIWAIAEPQVAYNSQRCRASRSLHLCFSIHTGRFDTSVSILSGTELLRITLAILAQVEQKGKFLLKIALPHPMMEICNWFCWGSASRG